MCSYQQRLAIWLVDLKMQHGTKLPCGRDIDSICRYFRYFDDISLPLFSAYRLLHAGFYVL